MSLSDVLVHHFVNTNNSCHCNNADISRLHMWNSRIIKVDTLIMEQSLPVVIWGLSGCCLWLLGPGSLYSVNNQSRLMCSHVSLARTASLFGTFAVIANLWPPFAKRWTREADREHKQWEQESWTWPMRVKAPRGGGSGLLAKGTWRYEGRNIDGTGSMRGKCKKQEAPQNVLWVQKLCVSGHRSMASGCTY